MRLSRFQLRSDIIYNIYLLYVYRIVFCPRGERNRIPTENLNPAEGPENMFRQAYSLFNIRYEGRKISAVVKYHRVICPPENGLLLVVKNITNWILSTLLP